MSKDKTPEYIQVSIGIFKQQTLTTPFKHERGKRWHKKKARKGKRKR